MTSIQSLSAHSGGAVADFHRLPEHPGVYCSSLGCLRFGQPKSPETTFSDINIYSGSRPRSQRTRQGLSFLVELAEDQFSGDLTTVPHCQSDCLHLSEWIIEMNDFPRDFSTVLRYKQ